MRWDRRRALVAGTGLLVSSAVCVALVYLRRRRLMRQAAQPSAKTTAGSPIGGPALPAPVALTSSSSSSLPPAAALATCDVTEDALSPEEMAQAVRLLQVLKQNANTAFQQGRFEDAMSGYQDCLDVLSKLGTSSGNGGGDAELASTGQVIRANVVMTLIKQKEYEAACQVATMLLQDQQGTALSPDLTVKVLFRRGLASKALGQREAALCDFRAAVQLSPHQRNPAAEREMALLSS